MADPISNLVSQLCRLPGVGTKSAQRLAYFILDMPESEAREIAKAINTYGGGLEGKKKAAEALGISLASLYNKMK